MTKITYEVVEHDGGWAYRVDGAFSETFPSHDMARRAAETLQQKSKSSRERRRASRTRTKMVVGTTKCRQAMIDPKPTSRAEHVNQGCTLSLATRSWPQPRCRKVA